MLLDLAEPAEHRRVIDAEPLGGARQRAGLGDGFYVTEVVPGKHLAPYANSVVLLSRLEELQSVCVQKCKYAGALLIGNAYGCTRKDAYARAAKPHGRWVQAR